VEFDAIIMNYANAIWSAIGETGSRDQAVEAVDADLGDLSNAEAARWRRGSLRRIWKRGNDDDPKTAARIPITRPIGSVPSRHGEHKLKLRCGGALPTLRPLARRHREKSPANEGTIANLAVMRIFQRENESHERAKQAGHLCLARVCVLAAAAVMAERRARDAADARRAPAQLRLLPRSCRNTIFCRILTRAEQLKHAKKLSDTFDCSRCSAAYLPELRESGILLTNPRAYFRSDAEHTMGCSSRWRNFPDSVLPGKSTWDSNGFGYASK